MTRSALFQLAAAASFALLGAAAQPAAGQGADQDGPPDRAALSDLMKANGFDCKAAFPVDLCAPQHVFVTEAETLAFQFGVAGFVMRRCSGSGVAARREAVGQDAAHLEKAMRARGYDDNRFFLFNVRTAKQFERRLARYLAEKKVEERSHPAICAALAEDLDAGAPIARYLSRKE